MTMRQPVAVLRRGSIVAFAIVIVLGYKCYWISVTTPVVSLIDSVLAPKVTGMWRKRTMINNDSISIDTDRTSVDILMERNSDHPQLEATTTASKAISLGNDQESQGHILVYSSYEEQTNGARNLWQLQMWAKTLKMRVAEPFAVDSMFGVIGALPNFSQTLRFSDYYDIDKWNKMVNVYGGSSLVQWEEFLSNSPRKVIVFYTLLREVTGPIVVTYGEDDVQKYDPGKFEHIPTEDMLWLKQNFNITRVVTFIRDARKSIPCYWKNLIHMYLETLIQPK